MRRDVRGIGLILCVVMLAYFVSGHAAVDGNQSSEDFELATPYRDNDGVLLPPSPVFSPTEQVPFLPHVPKVNVITGEYCEGEADLIVAGAEPLSLRRFYSHLGEKGQAYGHWRINPETLMLFNFASNYQSKFAGIGSEEGGFTVCDHDTGCGFSFNAMKNKSFTNTGVGNLSGQTHPLNTSFTIKRNTPGKHEIFWEGTIAEGSGRRRNFRTEIGLWGPGNNIGPVSQAWVLEDRKPNGNIIRYTYEDFNTHVKSYSHCDCSLA